MRESFSAAAAVGVVLLATLACKGSSSSSSSDAGGATPSGSVAAVGATCTESTKEMNGSLHAEVAYGAPFDPPKSKRKQSYQCGTKAAVGLYLEYPTAAAAISACNFTGPQLWGGNAPTREDKDELMTKGGTLVIVSGDAIDDLSAKLEADGYVRWRASTAAAAPRDIDVELGKAVDCGAASKDPLRGWCPVASLQTSGFSLPSTPKTYVGITAAVKTGMDVKAALLGNVSVSSLSLGPGKVKLTSVTPDNDAEKTTLANTAMVVAKALKGESTGTISIGKDLATFLDGLVGDLAISGHPVSASTGHPATFTAANPSDIALVHGKSVDAYVVLEHAKDGTWVNVFPVRAYGP